MKAETFLLEYAKENALNVQLRSRGGHITVIIEATHGKKTVMCKGTNLEKQIDLAIEKWKKS